ncbi:hypothetical protein ACFSO7_20785 [Bacillus sp. CGMCC 1.16607]
MDITGGNGAKAALYVAIGTLVVSFSIGFVLGYMTKAIVGY